MVDFAGVLAIHVPQSMNTSRYFVLNYIIRQIRNAHTNLCVKTPIDIFYLLVVKSVR